MTIDGGLAGRALGGGGLLGLPGGIDIGLGGFGFLPDETALSALTLSFTSARELESAASDSEEEQRL